MPPSPPQDCAGGITLCSDQAITTNQTDSGEVEDLNFSNQGCLSSEHMGTWYFFSPQTAGTIAFSITPANSSDDYDFAVWGPYNEAQCPTEPPLRCSWNAPPDYTVGLGNGATHFTEGASGGGWVAPINAQAEEVYVIYIDNWSESGQAFTLEWNLSNGATLDCTTLPVELLSLQAEARYPVIDVLWATASESNSDYFEVQRRNSDHTFTTIGIVPAAGFAQHPRDYRFVDESPNRGTNYYRLLQVDRDGASKRSHVVLATLGADAAPTIYPNPANDVLHVAFHSPLSGTVVLLVEDALGRTLAQRTTIALRGEHQAEVPLTGLATGWYHLRIALPDGSMLQGGGFLKK